MKNIKNRRHQIVLSVTKLSAVLATRWHPSNMILFRFNSRLSGKT